MFWNNKKTEQRVFNALEANRMTNEGLKIIRSRVLKSVMAEIECMTKYGSTKAVVNKSANYNYELFKDEVLSYTITALEDMGYKATTEDFSYKHIPYDPYAYAHGTISYKSINGGAAVQQVTTSPAPEAVEVKSQRLVISWG